MSEVTLTYKLKAVGSSTTGEVTIDVLGDTGFHCMDLIVVANPTSKTAGPITLKTTGWSQPPLPTSDEVINPGNQWDSGNGEWDVDSSTTMKVTGPLNQQFVVRFVGSASSCP